jgi:hypothetical protein
MNSSKPGGIKELNFMTLYKKQYKLMQENLPGINIEVDYWEDDLMINGFRKELEQMESNEEKIKYLERYQSFYGKFSDEFFQDLKNELGL